MPQNLVVGSYATHEAPITFDAIREPGTYVCRWSGLLLRVPKEASTAARPGRMGLVSNEQLYVTRISSDPGIPVATARTLAKEAGVSISF